MTNIEIEKLIESKFNSTFAKVERRDYRELEKKDPKGFLGYGKRSGLMYLSEHKRDDDLYIDANITEHDVKLSFRETEHKILTIVRRIEQFKTEDLLYFIHLTDKYMKLQKEIYDFAYNGVIPKDWIIDNKLENILEITV
jgi:hypothetical protein